MSVDPVFDTAPDLRFEGGPLAAWFTDPAGAVVQLTEAAILTKSMAEWLVGPGFALFSERFPPGSELRLLLDLRAMTSREPAARPVMMAAGTKYLMRFAKVGLIAPQKPPPLYMTTLHGAIALLSAIGPEVKIFDTVESALRTLELAPGGRKN